MVVVYFIAFYFIRNACNIYVPRDEQLTCYQSLAVCWWCYMARPGWPGMPQNGITMKFRSDVAWPIGGWGNYKLVSEPWFQH
jgi:hypothetical protein